ncbi:hypothetical protein [Frankia sp. BMG5.23]|uniref:hypothetical protein n=1 Tax=Frankia sp. BMG5.23 TaxID=683305 RepID=UPI0004612609|nr:hypothetical protein [Frankia sp. BMG5.23]KDA44869.1 hypothetical protein BMG523Draft_00393 [Frankia sp. BMG5.23]
MTLTGSPRGLLAGSPTIGGGSPGGWEAAMHTGRGNGPRRSRAPSPSRALPTRRPADEHARTLAGIAGYRVVPCRRAGGP